MHKQELIIHLQEYLLGSLLKIDLSGDEIKNQFSFETTKFEQLQQELSSDPTTQILLNGLQTFADKHTNFASEYLSSTYKYADDAFQQKLVDFFNLVANDYTDCIINDQSPQVACAYLSLRAEDLVDMTVKYLQEQLKQAAAETTQEFSDAVQEVMFPEQVVQQKQEKIDEIVPQILTLIDTTRTQFHNVPSQDLPKDFFKSVFDILNLSCTATKSNVANETVTKINTTLYNKNALRDAGQLVKDLYSLSTLSRKNTVIDAALTERICYHFVDNMINIFENWSDPEEDHTHLMPGDFFSRPDLLPNSIDKNVEDIIATVRAKLGKPAPETVTPPPPTPFWHQYIDETKLMYLALTQQLGRSSLD